MPYSAGSSLSVSNAFIFASPSLLGSSVRDFPPLPGPWRSSCCITASTNQHRRGFFRIQGADTGDEQEDNPNLFQVTPVPTYEEMLAWAEQVDARIAKGELSPIGSGRQTGDRGGADSGGVDGVLGSNQEQIELSRVSELLIKRRQQNDPLSQADASALRAALNAVTGFVQDAGDGSTSTENSSVSGNFSEISISTKGNRSDNSGEAGGGGTSAPQGRKNTINHVDNPIYGSREVRDTVYLYAWSLLKRQQEEADLVQEEDSR